VTVTEAAAVEDPEAAERARAEASLRLRRGRLATAIVAGTLVVIVGGVALLGGFRERTDQLTPVAVGSVIATGPYEVTLDKATVHRTTEKNEWEVVATGTARTTGATSIDPGTGSSGFVYAKDAAGGPVQPSQAIMLGETDAVAHLENLTPGLPPVPWAVSFTFAQEPSGTIALAVYEQEYTTPYIFSDELGWRPTRKASTLKLPLERTPDTEF
jgi:hypothetical protein